MNEVESLVNSLRAMELPKGAESLLGNILSKANAVQADRDDLKTKFDKREDENKTARDEIKGLKAKVTELEGAAPNAELLNSYQALGTPDELSGRLEKGENALIIAHAATMRENLRQLGYEPTERLLKDFADVTLSVKDSEDKKSKVGTVTADGKDVAFGDWLKTSGLEGDMARYRSDSRPQGVAVLSQYSGQGSSGVSGTAQIVNDLNAARSERPNPLLKGENNGTTNQKLS